MNNFFNSQSPHFLTLLELLIVASFIFWIFIQASHAWRINEKAKKRLQDERDAFNDIAKNLNILEDLSFSGGNKSATSVFTILSSARRSGHLDIEVLAYADWIQRSRYLAGIFVFIGLLGTVLGIGIAMTNLSVVFGSSTDRLVQSKSITSILEALGSAAWCTFVGILATLVVSHKNATYLQNAGDLELEIERYFLTHIRVLAIRDERQWMANSLQSAVKEAQQTGIQLLTDALLTFKDDMKEAHRSSNQQLTVSLTSVEKEMMAGMQSITSTIVAVQATVSSMNDTLLPTATILKQASETAQKVTETLEAVRERFDKSAQLLTDSLTSGHAQLEIIEKLVREGATTLESGYAALSTIASQLESTTEGINKERQEILTALWQDRTETLASLKEDRSKMLEDFATGLSSTNAVLGDEREALFKAVQTEARLAQTAAREALSSYDRLYNFHAEGEQKRQEGASQFVTALQHTEHRLAEVLARFEETLTEVAALSEQASLPKAITDLRGGLETGLGNIVKQQVETVSALRKQHTDLLSFQTELMAEWKAISTAYPPSTTNGSNEGANSPLTPVSKNIPFRRKRASVVPTNPDIPEGNDATAKKDGDS
jgi:hypothetical protein